MKNLLPQQFPYWWLASAVANFSLFIFTFYFQRLANFSLPLLLFHVFFLLGQKKSPNFAPAFRKNAQMAELVDALVSNTNGAIRAGSIPALGTIRGLL